MQNQTTTSMPPELARRILANDLEYAEKRIRECLDAFRDETEIRLREKSTNGVSPSTYMDMTVKLTEAVARRDKVRAQIEVVDQLFPESK
jgi:hypothetical protein